MNRLVLVLVAITALTGMTPKASAPQEPRPAPPTVAVVDFETAPAGSLIPPPHLGGALAELMLDRLVASGEYRVLDARWLRPVGDDGRPRDAFDALRHQLEAAGVDYVVLGSMTRFSTEDRHRRFGGAVFLPLLGGVNRRRFELAVGITVRLVDVRSGEVATTATAQAMADRRNVSVGLAGLFQRGGGGAFSNGSSGSRDAMLDEAIRRAIATAAQGIVTAASRLAKNVKS